MSLRQLITPTLFIVLQIQIQFQIISTVDDTKDGIYGKFTNVQCECPDTSYCIVEQCDLKTVSPVQSEHYLNISLKKRPITNLQVNFDIYRQDKAKYNPTHLNFTLDSCKFQQGKVKNRVYANIHKWVKDSYNLNHTCPFHETHFVLRNLTMYRNPFFDFMPSGNFKIKTKYIIDAKIRINIDYWIEYRNTKKTFLL